MDGTSSNHLIHFTVNGTFPKTDGIRYIAEIGDPAVIGISETKLDEFVRQTDIHVIKTCFNR